MARRQVDKNKKLETAVVATYKIRTTSRRSVAHTIRFVARGTERQLRKLADDKITNWAFTQYGYGFTAETLSVAFY